MIARNTGDPAWPGPRLGTRHARALWRKRRKRSLRTPYSRLSNTIHAIPRLGPISGASSHVVSPFRCSRKRRRAISSALPANRINRHSEKRSDDVVTAGAGKCQCAHAADRAMVRMLVNAQRLGRMRFLVSAKQPRRCCLHLNKTIYLGIQDDMPILGIGPSGLDFTAALPVAHQGGRLSFGLYARPYSARPARRHGASCVTAAHGMTITSSADAAAHETVMRDGGYRRTCPNCEAQHFSAHRSGRDHDGRARRQVPAGARGAFRARHVFLPRRVYRTRRDYRKCSAPRNHGRNQPA